jgi:predicted transposase YbfD/YdcC
MGIFNELQKEMQEVDELSGHNGYWYKVSDALIMLVAGALCGIETIKYIHQWAESEPTQQFLQKVFRIDKIMSRAQFYNILAVVKADAFKRSFIRWMQKVLNTIVPDSDEGGSAVAGKTVAIDGKAVNSTDKLTEDGSVLNIVSAYVSELKMTIGSHECMSKQGERAALRELLEMLELFGSVVVADALHCNKPTIEAILKAEADYLLVAKDNSPALKKSIEECLNRDNVPSFTTKEINGGRIETRTAFATSDLGQLANSKNWPNIVTVGAIHRQFENMKHGGKSDEWHYYISSASLSPEQLLHHARMEWGVESMHWLLDVHFHEDKTAVYDMNIQKILNTVRKIALNLVRIYKDANHKPNTSLKGIMAANLYDLDVFAEFVKFFCAVGELE